MEKLIKALLKDRNFSLAMNYAIKKHNGIYRACGVPYIYHPVRTFANLSHYYDDIKDNDLLTSALLHDTLEDTDATEKELAYLFGDEVKGIVKELTNPIKHNFIKKGEFLAKNIPNFSEDALSIKLADRYDNLTTLYPFSHTKQIRYIIETEKILYSLKSSKRATNDAQNHLIYNLYDKLDEFNPPIYHLKEDNEKTK